MRSKIVWYILGILRKVWVRVVAFAVLAVATVGAAQLGAPFIPDSWSENIGATAVSEVLSILTSSMLAVTTFSLAIATQAFAMAAQTATPRATELLEEDSTSQNVLATFLGAFLFGLVGRIALQAGYYSESGLVVLFVVTGVIVALVVLALLRWISHLMTFGRMADTLTRVEEAAKRALDRRMKLPNLGGRPLTTPVPDSCVPVFGKGIGHIQHIDVRELDKIGDELNLKVWIAALPGSFTYPSRPLMFVDRSVSKAEDRDRISATVSVGPKRDFEQDPGFGLLMISEIASRALSPGINDPGTAIDVVGRLVRILSVWRDETGGKIEFERVFVPPVDTMRMVEDAFRPIMRDGAGVLEVQTRIQHALTALEDLSRDTFGPVCATLASEALERAREAMPSTDYERLQSRLKPGLAEWHGHPAIGPTPRNAAPNT